MARPRSHHPGRMDEASYHEARFRTIFEQSPVSTQVFAPDGTTLAVNRAWERLWGVTLDQIEGYNVLQDPQLVAQGIMPYIERAFAGEAVAIPPIQYEPDKTIAGVSEVAYRWVSASMYPVRDGRGAIREVVLMHEDITDRMWAEEARRESEDRFRTLWEVSADAMALSDPEGVVVRANPAYYRLYGYTPEQVIGRSFAIIFSEDRRDRAVAEYRRVFHGDPIAAPIESVVRRADGSERIVEARYEFLVRDGVRVGMLSTLHDVTERHRVERALRESEARFRAIFDGAPVGIALVDPDGRYLAVNPVRQEMLGFSEEELLGRRYLDVTYPEDLEQDLQVNAEAQALGRDRFQLEKRFVGKDGGVSWTRVTVSTVRDDHGAPLYSISVAEDITELKNLERQKEDFLSAVAHDLRTPLTGIKGRIQLLRRRLDGPPVEPNRLQDDLSRMEANASRMAALLNELLDVRNIQSGRALNLVRRPVDLVRLVESLVREHQPMGDRHRLVVEAQEPELVGMWDPGRLERVLANLLSNAVKYSPAGREIVLGIGHEEAPGGQPAGRWAVVTVKDEGIGIPAADLPHVFEPFHRAENVVGKIAGTGVGLAATRLIVEQHGGTIGVESREGAGTTFTLRLPLGEVVET